MTRLFRVVRRGIELARGLTAEEAAARLAREKAAVVVEEPKVPQWDPTPDEKEES